MCLQNNRSHAKINGPQLDFKAFELFKKIKNTFHLGQQTGMRILNHIISFSRWLSLAITFQMYGQACEAVSQLMTFFYSVRRIHLFKTLLTFFIDSIQPILISI